MHLISSEPDSSTLKACLKFNKGYFTLAMEIEWSDNELASNTEVSLGYAIISVSIQCVKCAGIMVALKRGINI